MDTNWVAIAVAALSAGGLGAALREIVNVITLSARGVSGREDRRRADIIAARDWAIQQATDANLAREAMEQELENTIRARRFYEEQVALLRRAIIDSGGDPGDWPTHEPNK